MSNRYIAILGIFLLTGMLSAQSLPPGKQAIEQEYSQERAAGAENPAPRNPQAPYPIAPEVPFVTGVIDDDDAPFSSEDVSICNRWQGIQNGVRTLVYAGVDADDAQQGVVIVQTIPDYPGDVSGQRVLTPVRAGAVCVVVAQNGLLTLVSDTDSYVLTFNVSTGTFTSVIVDKTPPVISGLPVQGCVLWPPNHKFVQVADVTASDPLPVLAPGSLNVTGASNEPSNPTDPDIVITQDGSGGFTVRLRADRLGSGRGRVYTLTATASDLLGNTATATASCTVPHDQGK